MHTKKQIGNSPGISKPGKFPEIIPPLYPDDLIIPEDDHEIILDEDPFESPPPFENPEPGEGP